MCDFCAPQAALALKLRPADEFEQAHIRRIVEVLKTADGVGSGRVHAQSFPNGPLDRRGFEELLNAMARSRLVDIAEASFEKDGKRIDYRKVWLSSFGREEGAASAVMIPEEIESETRPRPRKGRKRGKPVTAAPAGPRKAARAAPQPAGSRNVSLIEAALKSWRLAEARRKHVPAFRILSDKTLQAIAVRQPRSNSELLAVHGIGPGIAGKYGADILRVLAGVAEG